MGISGSFYFIDLSFVLQKVVQMAEASRQSGNTAYARKMSARFRSYLFTFALAVTHELTHCFVAYLAQGSDSEASYTPPQVSHLNYAGVQDQYGEAVVGESGRWLENRLLGGSLEFYRDIQDDNGQVGIPYDNGETRI